jgi:protein-S-isoprenylcysteine O-methyltransferase Ste14
MMASKAKRSPLARGLILVIASALVIALALGFLLFMHVFVRRVEEPVTRRRFGVQYDDYVRRVPRWLPRLNRRVGDV